jgi:hypothetical protein
MRFFPGIGWLGTSLALTAGCGGFAPMCTADSDCAATSYCNTAAQACFVRSTGAAVPVIDAVVVGPTAGEVTVTGTAPAQSTVAVFTNAQCTGAPAGTSAADGSGNFSVAATAPSTGTVYATSESTQVGSVCSSGKTYP